MAARKVAKNATAKKPVAISVTPVEAKKPVAISVTPVAAPKVVAQLRFQGKIKARSSTVRSDGTVMKRSSAMNFGFIEVNNKDLKALQAHPRWTPDLAVDVFWHWKDCCYVDPREDGSNDNHQRAGDIVTFTVDLREDGFSFQAKQVKLVKRASWWHAVAVTANS